MSAASFIRQDRSLPALTGSDLLHEVRDCAVGVRQGKRHRVCVASRRERDGHKIALQFQMRRAISKQYRHSPSLSYAVFSFCTASPFVGLASYVKQSVTCKCPSRGHFHETLTVPQSLTQRQVIKDFRVYPASSPPNPSTQSRSLSSSPHVSKGRAAALFGSRESAQVSPASVSGARSDTGSKTTRGPETAPKGGHYVDRGSTRATPQLAAAQRRSPGSQSKEVRHEARGCSPRAIKPYLTRKTLASVQAGGKPAPLSNRTHSDDRPATPTSRLGAGRGENG